MKRARIFYLCLWAAWFFLGLTIVFREPVTVILSVEELYKDASLFDGKEVRVRGMLMVGPEEGLLLPTSISKTSMRDAPAVHLDFDSWLYTSLNRAVRMKFEATLTGTFEMRRGYGFGHMGMCNGQIKEAKLAFVSRAGESLIFIIFCILLPLFCGRKLIRNKHAL